MNIYKKRVAFTFLLFLSLQCLPLQSFWGQRFCARVSATLSGMSARVKNSFVVQKLGSCFSREKLKSVGTKTAWATTWAASCSSVALLHEDIRNRVFGVQKEEKVDKKTGIKTKGGYKTREYLRSLRTGRNNRDDLAIQVLERLDIDIDDIENPIAQIKNLSAEQQDAAFDYLMDIYPLKEDTNTLPTIYSVMEHLEQPKKQYKKFFDNVAANTGECCRESLINALIWQYVSIRLSPFGGDPLPPRLKAKFDDIGYNEVMDLWYKRKELPEWIQIMRKKLPCAKQDEQEEAERKAAAKKSA